MRDSRGKTVNKYSLEDELWHPIFDDMGTLSVLINLGHPAEINIYEKSGIFHKIPSVKYKFYGHEPWVDEEELFLTRKEGLEYVKQQLLANTDALALSLNYVEKELQEND